MSHLRLILLLAACALPLGHAWAGDLTRAEVIAIARSYAEYRWDGTEKNVRHGPDPAGVAVSTPSAPDAASAQPGYWLVDQTNTGMPYKWGGFDTLASFAAGVRSGKAAGDLYDASKRQMADRAVSDYAVGIDCSGFVSRCWKLRKKYGTGMLPDLCKPLASPADLKPGDILNYPAGHVVIFYEWLDEGKDRAHFYEAEPYSKVILSERSTVELASIGYRPWRYRQIKD